MGLLHRNYDNVSQVISFALSGAMKDWHEIILSARCRLS